MVERVERSEKRIDVEQVVSYLNRAFVKAAIKAAPTIGTRAVRAEANGRVETTALYRYQVDFCYLIDDIQRSALYIVPKIIQEANDLISRLEREAQKS